ncbi:MAG: bifunctional acyl-ACP--phospholipid O-acyltransferase/long-chain-fatty-acid--ACP ligase [Sulfuricurvum sp.]|jgi:acyl-[acyl-carrier-protein]-phospholipid O-acyltransferase/long-chain-fatty-acid--[acyl-carrier-protein] ligase
MIKFILKSILKTLFRIQVIGSYQPQESNTIIIANHQSFLDGLILGVMLPISPVFVINTEIAKRPIMRLLLSVCDYLVVDPTNPMAIKTIIKLVETGRPVVIFPEGRITQTGNLMKIYEGSAFVAAKTKAAILPVIIDGGHFSFLSRMHQEHPKVWFPRITITYCTPTVLDLPDHMHGEESRSHAGEMMRRLMQQSLLDARTHSDIFEAFIKATELFGKGRKIVEDAKLVEYSYSDLLKMTLGLGKLLTYHTHKGEAVGVMMPTAIASFGVLMGLSAFGRIPAMLNFTVGVDSLQSACNAACVKTIITSRAFVEQAKLESKLDSIEKITILYLEDLKESMKLWDKLWLIGYAMHVPRCVNISQNPADPAVILFTSGSEGKPKGVVLSHDALLSNIAQIRSIVDFSTDDKVLNALPIFHSFGLTAGTLLPLLGGIRLFMYPSPLHYKVIPEIAYDRSCTVLFGTNTFLNHYGKNAHPYDFYKIRYVVAGAEQLTNSVKELWFEKFGLRIFEGYGATETAPVIAVNTQMAYRSGRVGQILPRIEHQLINVPGIDDGGILHVKGPNIMSGYLRDSNPGILEKPSSDAGEGWYDTGDIVQLDADGFVKIIGRVKRFAKIAGEMVSLESVEKLALLASPIFLHASSSHPDEARGECIVLFTTDEHLKREVLQQAAREQGFPEIAIPRKIVCIPAIPVLGTGKTDYVTLKSMANDLA